MIIVIKHGTKEKEIQHIAGKIKKMGLKAHISRGEKLTVIGAIGDERLVKVDQLKAIACVDKVLPIMKPYKLASREFKKEDTIINVKGTKIGGKKIIVIAGPCSIENRKQMIACAKAVKNAGAHLLRGGAFKPRTSPYSFQGLEEEGLKLLSEAGKLTSLPVVTEVMDASQIEVAVKYADIIQIGARNMQNFTLLKALGKIKKPVLLKRGLAGKIEELLMSAEYIMSEGNHKVILCERGIRTFGNHTRNTLDLNIVPALKSLTHLPVIVDPSHGTGKWELVEPMSRAAIAAGADGLIIEVHINPEEALSDGGQSLKPKKFTALMKSSKKIAKAVGRSM